MAPGGLFWAGGEPVGSSTRLIDVVHQKMKVTMTIAAVSIPTNPLTGMLSSGRCGHHTIAAVSAQFTRKVRRTAT
jgi:hypothetical protein